MATSKHLQIVVEMVDKATKQLKQVGGSFDNLAQKAKTVGTGMTIAGGAITAFGAVSVKAFQKQELAVTKLTQIAKQASGATDAQVESLKQQAQALQDVGVVGDEVTLVGQAQLATFGLQTDSISTLTGSMLDLAVNQKGVNATQEDMMNIANLVGKAMDGQVGALSRVGVSFTEAQGEILKTGTEMEKASVLSEVLQQNVGGLNKSMRDTTQGGMAALRNDIGDLQEKIGGVISEALIPIVENIIPVIDTIQEWANSNPQLFSTIVTITAVIGGLMLVLGPLLIILPGLITAFGILASAVAFVASPVGIIVLAIGGLIATIALLIANWDAVKAHTEAIWQSMMDTINAKIDEIRSSISGFWDNVKSTFSGALETLKGWWETVWQFMVDHVGIVMEILFAVATGGMSLVVEWFINNREKIVNSIASVWDTVKAKAIGAFDGIKNALRSTMQFILGKVNKFLGGLNNALSKIPGVDLHIPTLPAFAKGGIVTKPTIGLIGEAGPEAVVPLNRGAGLGNTTININWSGAVDERSAEMVAKEVARVLDFEGRGSVAMGVA